VDLLLRIPGELTPIHNTNAVWAAFSSSLTQSVSSSVSQSVSQSTLGALSLLGNPFGIRCRSVVSCSWLLIRARCHFHFA